MRKPTHILWVDPNYQSIGKCVQALERQGLRTDYANSCAQALRMAKQRAYDLAIIDLLLPDALGMEAGQALAERCPNLTVILTTSSPSLRKHVRPKRKSVAAYLLKPVNSRTILSVVNRSTQRALHADRLLPSSRTPK